MMLTPSVRPHTRRAAYSLVEVVVGLTVFTMMAAGLVSMTFQVRSTAEENVYQNTAMTLAQGYVEQIRSIAYNTLVGVANDGDTLQLYNTDNDLLTDEGGGTLVNGDWATETVMLDEDPSGNPRQPMTFRFRPVLTDLNSATSGAAMGIEITVFFECTYNYGVTRTYRSSFRTVRSNVPTY